MIRSTYQHLVDNVDNGVVGILGITTSLQNTDIPRFQAKRKNIEGYIGTGFVDNADDSERYRYLFDAHAVGPVE